MTPHPPPYLTGPHHRILQDVLVGLFVNASLLGDPEYMRDRARILAIMDPELEALHWASEPGTSAEQLLAGLRYVTTALQSESYFNDDFRPTSAGNELPF